MKRKILAFFGAVLLASGVINLELTGGAFAAGCDATLFNLFPAWYNGLNCDSGKISSEEFSSDKLPTTIGKIAGNVLQDLFSVVGLLAVGFGIYAGFLMITASGDPGQIAKAKKTLSRAITGLILSLLATFIVTVIRLIFWR